MANFIQNIAKAFRVDAGRNDALPRRGLFNIVNATVDKKQQKTFLINNATLQRLANTDPITWAIRRVIKGYISQTPWDIVPDTAKIETELDRWEDLVINSINPYAFDENVKFESDIVPEETKKEIQTKLDTILKDSSLDDPAKRDRVRWLFNTMVKKIRHDAESHKHKVKAIFEHPNNTETSFRTLLEIVLEDILVYDAGIIIKNYDYYGELAELYTRPGYEIKLYRNEDGTAPEPPEPAYIWERNGLGTAEYTNDELLYITQNPQHTGYGKSPLEVAAATITASLYADQYNIDYFKQSNVPPGVINLGESVSEEQRKFFQKMWEQELAGKGGLHKLLITSGSDHVQFIPMRNMSNRDMQMMEYMKWSTAIKCACYGISPQDIGFVLDFHRTTSEVQEKLSKTRGINNLLNLMASYFNEEIVKAEFKFQDVKFEWQIGEQAASIQQAQIDKLDIDNGVLSINERRKKLGLKPVEGGDEYIVKGGAGVLVSDLAKVEETDRPENEMRIPGQPVSAPPAQPGQPEKPGQPSATGKKPGPESPNPIDGDPGRPTVHEQKENPTVDLKVNKNQSVEKQEESLNKTVEELRKQGIKTTIRIGFDE